MRLNFKNTEPQIKSESSKCKLADDFDNLFINRLAAIR